MPYPASPAEEEAIAKLGNGYFNNDPVSPSNPGGFDNGGSVTNFHEASDKVALAVGFAGDAAAFVNERATFVDEAVTEAAGYVGKMSGTSASSVTIGEGLKSFVTQAAKFFEPGRDIKIVSAANPATHWMIGVSTGYSGTNLTIDVADFEGEGSRSDWIVYTTSRPGDAGTIAIASVSAGTPDSAPTVIDSGSGSAAVLAFTIPGGRPAGLAYAWSTNNAATDPGAGKIKVSSASLTAATEIYISETDRDGVAVAAEIASWDDSTSSIRGRLRIFDLANPANFVTYDVVGAITDNGGWDTLRVVHVDHGGTIANNAKLMAQFRATGEKGNTGPSAYEVAVANGFAGTALEWLMSLEGRDGDAATVEVGEVVTGAPGSAAQVVASGSQSARVLNFALPAGPTGAVGNPAAVVFNFDAGTTDADPGNGKVRFNNAVFANVGAILFDNLDAFSNTVANWLDTLGDSTNVGNKGELTFVQVDNAARFAKFRVIGPVVDGSGFRRVPVLHLDSSGVLSGRVGVGFSPAGNQGSNGDGAGDVVGPASATVGVFAAFLSADGKTIGESPSGFDGTFPTLGDKPDAADIPFAPTGTIAATDTQSAIAELGTEKAPTVHQHAAGDTTSGTFDLARLPVAANGNSDAAKIVRADDTRLSNARTPTAHGHLVSDITGLATELGQKADADDTTAALALKSSIAGPVFTGIPAAPTPTLGTNSTQVATTAFVAAAIAALVNGAPGAVDTIRELADALGSDPNFATTITNALAGKQPLDSDLTAIAALTTQAFGRSVLSTADAAALRTLAQLVIGTDVQAYDADLAAIAGQANTLFGRGLLTLADAAGLLTAAGGLAATSKATAAQRRALTSDTVYNTPKSDADAMEFVSESVTGTKAIDWSLGWDRIFNLTGNTTLGQHTNLKDGQSGLAYFIQDATGSRTIAANTTYNKFAGGTVPTLSTAANSVDRMGYVLRNRGGTLVTEWGGLEKGIA